MKRIMRNTLFWSVLYFSIGFWGWFIYYRGWKLSPVDAHIPSFWLAYIMGIIIMLLILGVGYVKEDMTALWAIVGMAYAFAYRFNPTVPGIFYLGAALLIFIVIRYVLRDYSLPIRKG